MFTVVTEKKRVKRKRIDFFFVLGVKVSDLRKRNMTTGAKNDLRKFIFFT